MLAFYLLKHNFLKTPINARRYRGCFLPFRGQISSSLRGIVPYSPRLPTANTRFALEKRRKNATFAVMNDPILTQAVEAKLAHRDIRATSSRILVLRTLMTQESALALSDLEAILPTLDKSTLFRTLTTFAAHHLVHIVEDGSGLAKYALCADDCHCGEDENDELADLHTHFYCERCQRTFCLRGVPVPIPELPEGFSVRTVGFVVKGICDKCSGAQP